MVALDPPTSGVASERRHTGKDRRCPIRLTRCVGTDVSGTLLGTDRMNTLTKLNFWLARNQWRIVPVLGLAGLILACLAHWNDPQSVFITSAMRG